MWHFLGKNDIISHYLSHVDCLFGLYHIIVILCTDDVHQPSQTVQPTSLATAVPSNLYEISEMFQQMQLTVMKLLDQFPNALPKLKQVLASLVLPLGQGKVASLVDPQFYEGAQTVQELFMLMVPYWNPLSTDLLSLLLEASGCNEAASKVAEFSEVRASNANLVLCICQPLALARLDVANFERVHNAPLSELQSLHSIVFAQTYEHSNTCTRSTVRISVAVNKPLLCVADYEQITTTVSGFFQLPKSALVYGGCSQTLLVLCWLVSHDVVAYIRTILVGLSGHRLLVENNITVVAVGDQIYKVPNVKVREPWPQCIVYM